MKDMRAILADHARRYPLWAGEDLYKLIHQSAMGAEHALGDKARVVEQLVREIAALGPGPEEPLLDPISPDGAIVRVHLRPFARLDLDPGLLADTFIQTAQGFHGSLQLLEDYIEIAEELALEGRLQISPDEVQRFFGEMKAKGCPAVHHSSRFLKHYRPAYRVIASNFLPGEISAVA